MTPRTEPINNTADCWWKDPCLRRNVAHIVICYLAIYSLGYDGSLLNGIQALPTWNRDFGSPAGYSLGLIAASYYLPKIVWSPVVAFLNDRFGRKACILVGAIFMIAGALLGGLCTNISQLIGSRVMLGIGTATSQVAAATMIPELAHPRLRHICGSFLLTMFSTGSILAAWLTFAMVFYPDPNSSWAWKIPSLFQGLGPLLLLSAFWIPESPRWLIKNGRRDEAHRILAKYHANNVMDDELVLHEIAEVDAGLEVEKINDSTSWLAFVKTPANRRRLGIIVLFGAAAQLAGNGVVQYFLVPVLRQVGITKPAQTAGINSGLSVWNWLCAIIGALLVERVGRRTLVLFSFAGMLICFTIVTGLSGGYASTKNPSLGLSIVPFIFLFMGFYSSALTPVPLLYIPEITPLSIRAKAVGLYLTCTNLFLAFNNFVNPIALAAIGWKYYFVYIGTLVAAGALFYFFCRETKNLSTEEAAMVYEDAETKAKALEASQAAEAQLHRIQRDANQDKLSLHEVENKA